MSTSNQGAASSSSSAGKARALDVEARRKTCLLPYVDPETASPEIKAALNALPYTRNIFLLLSHASGIFPRLMDTYSAIFKADTRALPILEWQLVVLRISVTLDAQYEWEVNAPVARVNGMPEEKLDAMKSSLATIEASPGGLFTARDKLLLRLVDEQLKTYANTAETMETAKALFSPREIVEVYIIIGLYTFIARITTATKIDSDGEIPGLEDSLRKLVTAFAGSG